MPIDMASVTSRAVAARLDSCPIHEPDDSYMSRPLIVAFCAVLTTAAAGPSTARDPEPVFHPIEPASAKSLPLAALEQVPPPVTTGLVATVDSNGRVRYDCRSADNPAYAAYQARVEAAIRSQEPR